MTSAELAHAGSHSIALSCTGCGAVVDVEAGMRTAVCIYCETPGVIEKPRDRSVPEPVFVLPFIFAKDAALAALKRWLKSRSIFCRSGVRGAALEKAKGVYVPSYLYSCVASTRYSASIGEHYTVTYTTTVNGKRVTRTRTETEWRDLAGTHAAYVNDVVVTASKGIPNEELERIEPFDMRALRRMDASVLPGWIAEEPSLLRDQCLELARQEALDEVGAALNRFMPGDKHTGLTFETHFEREGADLILVPVWVLTARYDKTKPPLRILINGQTGQVGGKAPLSPLKITLTIVGAVLAIGVPVLIWYGRMSRWW